MTSSVYAFDAAWERERARLAGNEALWDEGTRAVLTRCGSATATAVLEVGAGAGSLVRWLAEQGADGARIVATDVDTRFIDDLADDSGRVRVEIRRSDIVSDHIDPESYDLIHSRMVLEHLGERDAVIARLAEGLRPGGWLVIEDLDWTGFGFDPSGELEERGANAVLTLMGMGGFDRWFGRRLPRALADSGLVDVHGEGRSSVLDADHPGYPFFALSLEGMAPGLVQAGMLTQTEVDEVRSSLAEGRSRIITPSLVAAIGRKPD